MKTDIHPTYDDRTVRLLVRQHLHDRAPPRAARSTSSSATSATRSSPASRSWWTPAAGSSASSAATASASGPPRADRAARGRRAPSPAAGAQAPDPGPGPLRRGPTAAPRPFPAGAALVRDGEGWVLLEDDPAVRARRGAGLGGPPGRRPAPRPDRVRRRPPRPAGRSLRAGARRLADRRPHPAPGRPGAPAHAAPSCPRRPSPCGPSSWPPARSRSWSTASWPARCWASRCAAPSWLRPAASGDRRPARGRRRRARPRGVPAGPRRRAGRTTALAQVVDRGRAPTAVPARRRTRSTASPASAPCAIGWSTTRRSSG